MTFVPNTWSFGRDWHVAQRHPEASDENPGTAAQPFETISAAARVAHPYDRVLIDEGIYREQVPVVRHGKRGVAASWIVFAAVPGKEVYLRGSDPFEPEWEEIEPGMHQADLPATLFDPGAYNPYAIACAPAPCPVNYEFDRAGYDPGAPPDRFEPRPIVRPAPGPNLPETLGQVYVDDDALDQVDTLDRVRASPGSFLVSADGRRVICHFAGGVVPGNASVEITVRERCFKPQFTPHWSGLMIRTVGIVADRAADPGAFSRCRPLTVRRNPRSGISIRKTFYAHCGMPGSYVSAATMSYLRPEEPTMITSILDGTRPDPPGTQSTITITSEDGFRTWRPLDAGSLTDPVANYFLDEQNGMLLRHYRRRGDGTIYNDKAVEQHDAQELVLQVSADAGRTWGPAEKLGFGDDIICFTLMKLRDGRLLWMIVENHPELSPVAGAKPDAIYFVCRAWLGTWRSDRSGVDWERGGSIQIPQEMGTQGVDEPQVCQLPDGRLFVILRQAVVLPAQDRPGYPSVKLISVSQDHGQSWSDPEPLTFEDGSYAYSSTSFSSAFRSSRNDRVYVVLNILNGPNEGCLPRNVLHIAEIDQQTCRVRRDTVTVVEEVHEEHTHDVGYSNWSMIEDRDTKRLLLFMNLENGPVGDGYDWCAYRYEIELPG